MIIDSHCHLNYEPMSLSLKETIDRANKDGVKYLLTISTEDKSYDKILNIISNNDCLMIKGSNATGLNNFSKNIIKGI